MYNVLDDFIKSSNDLTLIRKILPWALATYDMDQGVLLQLMLSKTKYSVPPADAKVFWQYGLLSRNVE